MHTRLLTVAWLITVTTTFAADAPKLPAIPEQPIAKKKMEFGCMGKDGFFDDLKIWNAEPVK